LSLLGIDKLAQAARYSRLGCDKVGTEFYVGNDDVGGSSVQQGETKRLV